jgi:hypothetical protein
MTPEAFKEKLLKRIKRGQLTLKRCGQNIDALITKLEHTRIRKDRVKWKLEHNELELVDGLIVGVLGQLVGIEPEGLS